MKTEAAKTQGFQFVSVIPSATDVASKAAQRRLVRSNAASYQWSRQKRKPKLLLKDQTNEGTSTLSQEGTFQSSELETPIAEEGDENQITAPRARSGTYLNIPELPSVYETVSLLPEKGIAHLMRFSKCLDIWEINRPNPSSPATS
jgi:hypothetical protein